MRNSIFVFLFLIPFFLQAQESGFHGYGDIIRAQQITIDTFELRIVFTGGNTIDGQYIVDSLKINDKIFSSCAPYTVVSISLQTSGIAIFRISDPYSKGMPTLGSRCAVYRETTNKNLVRTNISNAMNYGISPNELNCLTQNLISQIDTLMTSEEITLWTQIESSDTIGAIAIAGPDSIGTWSDSLRYWQGKLRNGVDTMATLADVRTLGGSNYWTKTGSDIYYSAGKVAIGTSTMAGALNISGNIGTNIGSNNFKIGSSYGSFASGSVNFVFGTTNGTSATTSNRAFIFGTSNGGSAAIMSNIFISGASNFSSATTSIANSMAVGESNFAVMASSNYNFGFGGNNFQSATSGSGLFAAGFQNFKDIVSPVYSVGIGLQNYKARTSGQYLYGFGNQNNENGTSGLYWTLFGQANLRAAASGNYAFAAGNANGSVLSSINNVVAFGGSAFEGSTGAANHTFTSGNTVGGGSTDMSPTDVIGIGNQALRYATSLDDQIAFGYQAGYSNTFTRGVHIGRLANSKRNNEISFGSSSYNYGRLDITGQVRMPLGTTAERQTAEQGDFRANSNNSDFEGYSGSEWKRFAWYNSTNLDIGSYSFNIDQTVGASQDNYALIYDDASGEIGLEAIPSGADNWGTDVVNSDGTLTGDGTVGTPLKVDTTLLATITALNDSIADLISGVVGAANEIAYSDGAGGLETSSDYKRTDNSGMIYTGSNIFTGGVDYQQVNISRDAGSGSYFSAGKAYDLDADGDKNELDQLQIDAEIGGLIVLVPNSDGATPTRGGANLRQVGYLRWFSDQDHREDTLGTRVTLSVTEVNSTNPIEVLSAYSNGDTYLNSGPVYIDNGLLILDNTTTGGRHTGVTGGASWDTTIDRPVFYDGTSYQSPIWESDEESGSTTGSTDASGVITISHSLGSAPSVVVANAGIGGVPYLITWTSSSGTNVSFKIYKNDGTGLAASTGTFTIDYILKK